MCLRERPRGQPTGRQFPPGHGRLREDRGRGGLGLCPGGRGGKRRRAGPPGRGGRPRRPRSRAGWPAPRDSAPIICSTTSRSSCREKVGLFRTRRQLEEALEAVARDPGGLRAGFCLGPLPAVQPGDRQPHRVRVHGRPDRGHHPGGAPSGRRPGGRITGWIFPTRNDRRLAQAHPGIALDGGPAVDYSDVRITKYQPEARKY